MHLRWSRVHTVALRVCALAHTICMIIGSEGEKTLCYSYSIGCSEPMGTGHISKIQLIYSKQHIRDSGLITGARPLLTRKLVVYTKISISLGCTRSCLAADRSSLNLRDSTTGRMRQTRMDAFSTYKSPPYLFRSTPL